MTRVPIWTALLVLVGALAHVEWRLIHVEAAVKPLRSHVVGCHDEQGRHWLPSKDEECYAEDASPYGLATIDSQGRTIRDGKVVKP